MSKCRLAQALVLGALLAGTNLAGMTAIAHAQANDQPTTNHTARRPPTQAQVGEPYRHDHDALAAQGQSADIVERFRQSERASQEPPTTADTVARFRQSERASQEQPAIADDSRRPPTEAQVDESWRYPGSVRAPSAEPSGRPGWLVPGLVVLAAALVLTGGLAVTTTRRARRRVRVGQAV
jgi:hypothetical protein